MFSRQVPLGVHGVVRGAQENVRQGYQEEWSLAMLMPVEATLDGLEL
jgi:hypothetical protein